MLGDCGIPSHSSNCEAFFWVSLQVWSSSARPNSMVGARSTSTLVWASLIPSWLIGLSRGLHLLWHADRKMNIRSFSFEHIYSVVSGPLDRFCRLMGFYGHPCRDQLPYSWSLLRRLHALSSLSWCCFGDFNESINYREEVGSSPRP